MEEDKKISKELRKELGLYADGNKVKQGIAIENILAELEKVISRLKKDLKECKNNTTTPVFTEDLETVLKELERLQEENTKIQTEIAEHVYWESTPLNEIIKRYIPKDKIREKLEDLEKQYKEALEENSIQAFILKCQIEIFKKLLEEKKYHE